MDIEQLNKTQIILLTLLVSFVTSIATGIVTVTLMDQAPPGVTQTINRVVKKTERIIVPQRTEQKEMSAQALLAAEAEYIAEVVKRGSRYVVTLHTATRASTASSTPETTQKYTGVAINETTVAAPLQAAQSKVYTTFDGEEVVFTPVARNAKRGFALFRLGSSTAASLPFAPLAGAEKARVGETVVALHTRLNDSNVRRGLLSGVDTNGDAPADIYASLQVNSLFDGAGLFNLNGELLGIVRVYADGSHSIISVEALLSTLEAEERAETGETASDENTETGA